MVFLAAVKESTWPLPISKANVKHILDPPQTHLLRNTVKPSLELVVLAITPDNGTDAQCVVPGIDDRVSFHTFGYFVVRLNGDV